MPINIAIHNLCHFIKETELFQMGHMNNTQAELLILRKLRVHELPRAAPALCPIS